MKAIEILFCILYYFIAVSVHLKTIYRFREMTDIDEMKRITVMLSIYRVMYVFS